MDGTSELTHALHSEDAELVLGIVWKLTEDTIGFQVADNGYIKYTRSNLLSIVAGIFDPLGTAAPITVKVKNRLRQLDGKGLGLTDHIAAENQDWWEQWFQTLYQLRYVEFTRCLLPNKSNIYRLEPHTFCDASTEAYAAVVYIRLGYRERSVVLWHIKAVTKLSPNKTFSIPKLELNAVLLGAHLERFTQAALTKPLQRRLFWTDSRTVRNWIRSTTAFYQTFVSHRLGKIQTLTEAEEWRFVPGKLNPATRSVLDCEAIPMDWLDGPEFLYQPAEDWPADLLWIVIQEEIRSTRAHLTESTEEYD